MPTVNFSQLKLLNSSGRVFPTLLEDPGYGDEEDYGEEEELDRLNLEIVDAQGRRVGEMDFFRYNLLRSPEHPYEVFEDEFSEESAFYCTLIDDEGGFRRDVARAGTRVWEKDTLHSGIVLYLQELRVEPEYQRQGVATWALEQIWGLRTFIFAEADVIFTLPDALNPADAATEEVREAARARSIAVFHKSGYCRVGASQFFAQSRNPNQPSRRLPASQDAARVLTAGVLEDERSDWAYGAMQAAENFPEVAWRGEVRN